MFKFIFKFPQKKLQKSLDSIRIDCTFAAAKENEGI